MKTLFLLLQVTLINCLAAADRPNVVLIMADDFGYECVQANGGESYPTPNLDKLAAGGLRFEHCHVQPLCTPTRVQLMTGRYNIRNYINFGTLPKQETTFGQLMKQAGYATGICGKWQLGAEPDLPQHFGFDEAYLWQHTRRPPRYANPGLEHNAKPLDFQHGEYGPELVNDFALDFITRHQTESFFLYYPMILTHDPFQPTPDSPDWDPTTQGEKAKQANKHFADMTVFMDKMIGRLVAKLESLELSDNTLILFLGDNGTSTKITSRYQGADYHGGKGDTSRRGTHVPMIASWPGVIKPGVDDHRLVSSTDFLPTLCDAAGVSMPPQMDGISFMPELKGEKGQGRDWLYTWYSPRQKQDLKVKECAFTQQHKLYRDGSFYDLVKDPDEKHPLTVADLTGEAAQAAAKLGAVLEQFKDARPHELDEAFIQSGVGKEPKAQRKKDKK